MTAEMEVEVPRDMQQAVIPFRRGKGRANATRKTVQKGTIGAKKRKVDDESTKLELDVPRAIQQKAVGILRRQLMNNDYGQHCRQELPGNFECASKLEKLLRATIVDGTNNSVLLLGAPGCAKREILESVLSRLNGEFNKEQLSPNLGIIRLSGLVHSDECTALREIAKQLCSIWKLHFLKSASFSTNLRFFREMLSELEKGHKTVIFVLDCFDLYTIKQKQGLLYNLLDTIQNSNAQAAVVGLSNRHDCIELMEKRARSRFSYRKIVVSSLSRVEGMQLVEKLVTVTSKTADFEHFNHKNKEALSSDLGKSILDKYFKCNVSNDSVEHLALELICSMEKEGRTLTLDMLRTACGKKSGLTFKKQITQLPIIELILLIAMHRMELKKRYAYNFHHVYEEYQQMFTLYAKNSRNFHFGKEAALQAYVRLVEQKFVMLTDTRRYMQIEFRMACLLVMGMDLESAISHHPHCPEVLRHWLGRRNLLTR